MWAAHTVDPGKLVDICQDPLSSTTQTCLPTLLDLYSISLFTNILIINLNTNASAHLELNFYTWKKQINLSNRKVKYFSLCQIAWYPWGRYNRFKSSNFCCIFAWWDMVEVLLFSSACSLMHKAWISMNNCYLMDHAFLH